ncbi:MAG: TAXI family TRAP transporter solute-binding subunit [Hyphomicrobiales bacterium]|nr:TAXI family TRAP transporter solute-binding subunit [Hyphomicrobiales bacterium]
MAAIRIGTSEQGGTFWTQGQAVATLLRRDHGLDVQVLDAEQASIENARRLEDSLIDFGFMASNWIGRAYRGEPPFESSVAVRMVAPANAGAMFFIVRADSPLRTVRDMIGKRVAIGPAGSGMVQHIHTIFGALGISFDQFTPLNMSFEDGGKALEAGDIDVQWQCPYPNEVMREISERLDVRVLDYGGDDLKTVLDKAGFYRHAIMPKGFFRGIERDTEQLAVVNIIATHERADDAVVGKLVSTLLNNLDELARINPLFTGLGQVFEPLRTRGTATLEFGGVPLHPGAIAAYRDAGLLK